MSRNRFFDFKSFLHNTDNQFLSESRMAKVEPLYDLLNKNYKLLVLAIATGVPYKIEIYQGRTNPGSDESLGTRVVKNAWEICKNPKDHNVNFDNFFSSYSPICGVTTKDFRAIDTMRNDWIMKCPLVDVKKMKINERGSFDYRSDGNIEIIRWNDNYVVTIGNNAYGVQPIGSAKRWIKGKGKQNIQQPAVIARYNQRMGGVDLLDCALSN